MGGNGNLGDSKFVVAEKAGRLPRDEEARRGDILRIEREREREGNDCLGNRKNFISERAGRLPRDEEARRGEIFYRMRAHARGC